MIGLSNSIGSKSLGSFTAAKTYTPVGSFAVSTSAVNGKYSLYATFLATFPDGHGITSGDSNVGSLSILVRNTTQGYVEKASIPLQVWVVVGNSVFFRTASSIADGSYENIGLTNPSSGDVLKISLVANIFGYLAKSSYSTTSTLS